jgi:hypothetical protein
MYVQCQFQTTNGMCPNRCLASKRTAHCWMHTNKVSMNICNAPGCEHGTRSKTGFCVHCSQKKILMHNKRVNSLSTCAICQVTVQDLKIHSRGKKHLDRAEKYNQINLLFNQEFQDLCDAYESFE